MLVADGYFWDLVVKSGLKNSIFSHISCCQITFQQQAIYKSVFLKSSFIWMHIKRSTTYICYDGLHIGFTIWPIMGTMISILDFQNGNLLWVILQIGNFLRYNSAILYISLGKVQWCVHGHWIHMQRSYEVDVIITSVFWFNPACGIYVKILWWYFCPQLCLLSDNSRCQIWVYNNYLFLPGHIPSIDSKWYTGLPCTHWKHTSLTKLRK